jgi:hypothetical protein
MKRNLTKVFTVMAAVLLLSITVLEFHAEARAGGSRSSGSRGARSYSRPAAAPSISHHHGSRLRLHLEPFSNQQVAVL